MSEHLTALTALLIAIGGVPAIIKLLDWFKATKSGRASAEKRRNRMALNELEETSEYLRIMQEYASRLRRILIELGIPEDRIPTWPARNPKA